MAQQGEDRFWQEAKEFVKQHLQPEDRLLAPVALKEVFPHASSYQATYKQSLEQFEWLLLHKGMLSKINRSFLKQASEQFSPVFANQVFVVLTKRKDLPATAVNPQDMAAFLEQVNPYERWSPSANQSTGKLPQWRQRIRHWLGTDATIQAHQFNANAIADCINRVERNTTLLQTLIGRVRQLEAKHQQIEIEIANLGAETRRLGHSVEQLQQQIQFQSLQQRTWAENTKPIAQMTWAEFQLACRVACQTSYLGNNTLICRVLGKYLLYADSQDLGIVPHLSLDGFWETWMTLAVARILQPGWHCIDVGANHGYYTLLMADAIGTTGRILALEPNPQLATLLQQTIDVNGFAAFTTVLAKAAIDQPGEPIKLVIPKGRGMNASVTRYASETDEAVEVETTSIDTLTQDWQKLDFIKIDAEGAEESIWQGLRQTIQRHSQITIVLEFNCGRYPDPKGFLEMIQADGFELKHIDFDAEVKPLTIEECLTHRLNEDWLLFLKQSTLDSTQ